MDEQLAFKHGTVTGIARRDVAPKDSTIAAAPSSRADPPVARAHRLGLHGPLALHFRAVLPAADTIAPLAALPLSEIAAAIALGALVAGRLMRGQSVIRVTPEVMAVAALGGVMLLTAPLSIWPVGPSGRSPTCI